MGRKQRALAEREAREAAREAGRKTPSPELADGKPEKKKETTVEFIASMAVVLVVGLFIHLQPASV